MLIIIITISSPSFYFYLMPLSFLSRRAIYAGRPDFLCLFKEEEVVMKVLLYILPPHWTFFCFIDYRF
jgi:hypothetical protein